MPETKKVQENANVKANDRTEAGEQQTQQQGIPKGIITLEDGSRVRVMTMGRRPIPWYLGRIVRGMLRNEADAYIVTVPWGAAYTTTQSLQMAAVQCAYRVEHLGITERCLAVLVQKASCNLRPSCLKVWENMRRPQAVSGGRVSQ